MSTPILDRKNYAQLSVFNPANLLREARRQKNIPAGAVPEICVLDPDGDLSRHLKNAGCRRDPHWACYHTELLDFDLPLATVGVVGCAVGAPFAVLVAEELFVSGCKLLISVTSAGQIIPAATPPYMVLIDRALRDEGTSYHYQPAASYAVIQKEARSVAQSVLTAPGPATVVSGGTWTTDAPFRETEAAIAFARSENLLAVEMEAAALYALSEAKGYPIMCFAHVTNQMGLIENDFEKGAAGGNQTFIHIISTIVQAWRDRK